MIKVLLLALLLAIVNLQLNETENNTFVLYEQFLQTYSKVYENSEEMNDRYFIFLQNYKKLLELKNLNNENDNLDNEDKLYLDVTNLFDMTEEDFHKIYLNLNVTDEELNETNQTSILRSNGTDNDSIRHLQNIPANFDWRTRGVITRVKNQGYCGACYAFAVSGNIESQYAIKYGVRLDLSEQQIINCDYNQNGCNGGSIAGVMDYLKRSGGLGLETSMVYRGRKQYCYNIQKKARIIGKTYAGTDENYIQSQIFKYGPLATGVNAKFFKYYKSGIMTFSNYMCSPYTLNHAVLIVGYGVTNRGYKYWIIKNSWGANWGENGYIRIGRGVCGINRIVIGGIVA